MSASELGCRIAGEARQLRSPGYLEELESNPDCIPGRYTYAYVSRLSAQIMRFLLHAPCKNPQGPESRQSDPIGSSASLGGSFLSSFFFLPRVIYDVWKRGDACPCPLPPPPLFRFPIRFTQRCSFVQATEESEAKPRSRPIIRDWLRYFTMEVSFAASSAFGPRFESIYEIKLGSLLDRK